MQINVQTCLKRQVLNKSSVFRGKKNKYHPQGKAVDDVLLCFLSNCKDKTAVPGKTARAEHLQLAEGKRRICQAFINLTLGEC